MRLKERSSILRFISSLVWNRYQTNDLMNSPNENLSKNAFDFQHVFYWLECIVLFHDISHFQIGKGNYTWLAICKGGVWAQNSARVLILGLQTVLLAIVTK